MSINNMKCPNCGIKILASSKFCKHCGIEIATFKKKEIKEENKTYNQPYTYKSVGKKNNPWLGWLIFLGIIGFLIFANNSSNNNINATTPAGEPNPPPPSCSNPVAGQIFNSLPNGSTISDKASYFSGQGDLTINNGTEDDAVVKIVDISSDTSIGEYYIDANNKYVITGIVDGNYDLYFSLGKNWDEINNKFITCKSFSKFDDSFNYTTTDTQYTTYNITLNPVVGGTATTTSVDESAFEKY